ncbi:hypothetical protein E9531_06450 [Lampropedia puyangensis]|uniref:Zinc-ribbon domain-containing protein n=1 Tax=Lampropedia puyangensis TaxID=1330072 RepID=A0A4S8F760_9BURK|nr:putative zinc-binding metallopeptidase [Lampropedia puyangensis]THU02741.1 hypothetical protein E9531_06450 [Lampropedia puyangensis]
MQTFQCTQCANLVFFDSQVCVNCGSPLGFDPESLTLLALQSIEAPHPSALNLEDAVNDTTAPTAPVGDSPLIVQSHWQLNNAMGFQIHTQQPVGGYKFCKNHIDAHGCNFLLAASDSHDYCLSCRQTETIPNLSNLSNLHAWITIENAKRRLFYSLAKLGLKNTQHPPKYDFLEDIEGQDPVMTGHANGLITLNIAEADDAERTRRRINLHEPYRTLLGHLRHEVGHFYWDQFFIRDEWALAKFRLLFGDERLDYSQALQQHYQTPQGDWQNNYVSSYASAHPWEDWAETWAHYLHLIDLQETASSYQLQFAIHGTQGVLCTQVENPFTTFAQAPQDDSPQDISHLLNQSMGISLVLNSLNRSLGHNDAYPFALSSPVLQKLGFVHNAIRRYAHQKNRATLPDQPAVC